MNNNLSCNWNGQRWTPTVTNLQDQWASQNPPGVARGKVWQPKTAPPPPSPRAHSDIEDMNGEMLEEAVIAGYPLDLSTFKTASSSRNAESPLDLSLKTRKRCADSTLHVQHYGQIGKKMCLPTHGKQNHVAHGPVDGMAVHAQQYIPTVELRHHNTDTLLSKQEYRHSRQHVQQTDHLLAKQVYDPPKQHIQNIQHVQHERKGYYPDHTDVRRYSCQTVGRQYTKPSTQQFFNDTSKSHPQHYVNPVEKLGHHSQLIEQKLSRRPPVEEPTKYSSYHSNVPHERDLQYRDSSKYFPQQQSVLPTNVGVSQIVKTAESPNYHSQMMSQVQKTVPLTKSVPSSRYFNSHSPLDSYGYPRSSMTSIYSPSSINTSSKSPSSHQNRPSVLAGGLNFKQPHECCSPDSTFANTSNLEYSNYMSRSPVVHSPGMSRDIQSRRHLEKGEMIKGKVSSTSSTPSSSPRSGYFPNSPNNMISNRKSPSIKSVSKLTVYGPNTPDLPHMMQPAHQARSIVMGTSGSSISGVNKESPIETVIRHPQRPRLWNPDQSKLNTWKQSEEMLENDDVAKDSISKGDLSLLKVDTKVSKTIDIDSASSKPQLHNPLEIAIPSTKSSDQVEESKPRPFSKKHIIMNAFRKDESMKHILDEPKIPKPVQPTETVRNTPVRSLENSHFISPESPKMPTLSPQQKLPAPKVSPSLREPPTLDMAGSQGNRRKQNKVSPNKVHLKTDGTDQRSEQHDYSIQPQSSFPQRQKVPYKKIPVANVAPMIHGKCNAPEQESNIQSEKETSNTEFKHFVSIPTPPPVQAFRVSDSIMSAKDVHSFDVKSQFKTEDQNVLQKPQHYQTFKSEKLKDKNSKKMSKPRICKPPVAKKKLLERCREETGSEGASAVLHEKCRENIGQMVLQNTKCFKKGGNPKENVIHNNDDRCSARKPIFISNTKRKADEIRRKARERNNRRSGSGKDSTRLKIRQLRRRLDQSPRGGFIDFKPEVLESRTRRKSAGRRGYHRNAAYEKELWREEKRKAYRHRQRVRRFNKKFKKTSNILQEVPHIQQQTDEKENVKAAEKDMVLEENTEPEREAEAVEDNTGTWEIKNTSTTLRNGKSKGVSMKILFKPQEERRFRRRMKKRGKIRYGLRKTVSAPSKLINRYQEQYFEEDSEYSQALPVNVNPVGYSEYDFDDTNEQSLPVPYVHSLPEVKKLSVCKDTGETILHRAARMGHEDVALSYLQTGIVDVNVQDNAGYTPLHESCASGNINIARMLLSYGATVNCASQDGIRPIHDAVDNDFVSLVRLLLSYGADPTISTYGGKTPLKIAHSKKMKSLIQGYLGDINGFQDDPEKCVWEFHGFDNNTCEGDDVFNDIPSDPESEEDLFEESSTPMFPEFTLNSQSSDDKSCVVLLKDISDFLHIKTSDIKKDKEIRHMIIEDAKETLQTSSEYSFYYDRLQSIMESSCWLLPPNAVHLVLSGTGKKRQTEKVKKCSDHGQESDEKRVSEKERKKYEKVFDHSGFTTDHSSSSLAKSPKHKAGRSQYDFIP